MDKSMQREFGLKAFSARLTVRSLVWLAVFVAALGAAWLGAPAAQSQAAPAARVHGFAPLGAHRGWVWAGATAWRTGDDGVTWQPVLLPSAAVNTASETVAAVALADADRGWALLLGDSGGALAATRDGGRTWQRQPLPAAMTQQAQGASALHLLSAAGDPSVVWLAATLPTSSNFSRGLLWGTRDDGATWQALTLPSGGAPVFDDARGGWIAGGADGDELWRTQDGGATWAPDEPGAVQAAEAAPVRAAARVPAEGPVALRWAAGGIGWAYAEQPGKLFATSDGGQTWRAVRLPPGVGGAPVPAIAAAVPAPRRTALSGRIAVAQGPGFDACSFPTVDELATWFNESPYRSVNLYIGGVLRFCKNEGLTAPAVQQASDQGWTFIPTWVGPQAPCTTYHVQFDANTSTAFAQGKAEAAAALAAARGLGLAEPDGSGTIIYYDLESFVTTDAACIAATQAFVAGWTEGLHGAGSQAGLYGSACSPGVSRFANSDPAPDAVWVAQWNRDGYDPAMTVRNLACVDNSLWSRSQRIRQYTGGHTETYGSVALEIDSNVLDGPVVALPAQQPTPTPTATATPTPTPTPIVLETPELQPPYDGGMCGAGWYMHVNERNYPAFVAANRQAGGTIPPPAAVLAAEWQPSVPLDGRYRVEVFIPALDLPPWQCPTAQLSGLTTAARYTIRHAVGSTEQVVDQAGAAGGWVALGVYTFRVGGTALVRMDIATDEPEYTRAIAASALRLTPVDGGAPWDQSIFLPFMHR